MNSASPDQVCLEQKVHTVTYRFLALACKMAVAICSRYPLAPTFCLQHGTCLQHGDRNLFTLMTTRVTSIPEHSWTHSNCIVAQCRQGRCRLEFCLLQCIWDAMTVGLGTQWRIVSMLTWRTTRVTCIPEHVFPSAAAARFTSSSSSCSSRGHISLFKGTYMALFRAL